MLNEALLTMAVFADADEPPIKKGKELIQLACAFIHSVTQAVTIGSVLCAKGA